MDRLLPELPACSRTDKVLGLRKGDLFWAEISSEDRLPHGMLVEGQHVIEIKEVAAMIHAKSLKDKIRRIRKSYTLAPSFSPSEGTRLSAALFEERPYTLCACPYLAVIRADKQV